MVFKVKISGMNELRRNMDQVVKDMQDAMEMGVDEAAEYAAGVVRRNTPIGPTGNLRKSITTKPLPPKKGYPAVTLVGASWPLGAHGHLVEFGTVKSRANPFFRRSIDQAKAGIKGRIGDSAKSVIDRRR